MASILTPEDVVRRIATECTFIDERGAVGIRLKPDGQVRWLLDKCDWGAVAAGALRAAKAVSISSLIALS